MRVCSKTKHVTLVTHNICKSQIHTLSALQSNKKESLSSSVLIYSSKRYWNKRNQFRLTRKQRSKRKEHERKYQNSYNDDSNWFPEVDVDTQTIPISMKAPPQNSNKVHKPLKLDDEFWKHWQSVEHSLNLESLYQEIEKNVNEIVNSFDYKLRFANPSDKSKLLSKICQSFSAQIQSSDLRNIRCESDIVEWLYNKERNEMIKKWHRERYMTYNLPNNLIVELPWFYCLGNENSPFKRPLGVKV